MHTKFKIALTVFMLANFADYRTLYADDLNVACGSYRDNLSQQNDRCNRVKLALDRSLCVQESVVAAEKAYAACIRSFNTNGAKRTIEKSKQSKKPRAVPDAVEPDHGNSSKTLGL